MVKILKSIILRKLIFKKIFQFKKLIHVYAYKLSVKAIANKTKIVLRRFISYPIIYNVNNVEDTNAVKRALFVYLVKPFLIKESDPRFFQHQNMKRCKQFASVLGEKNYVVDVADISKKNIKSRYEYDLVLSHNYDLDKSKISLKKNAIKIYLSTGMNHIINNTKVRIRYENVKNRRNCKLKIRRTHNEQMPFLTAADFVIGVGNEYTAGTWVNNFHKPIFSYNNFGFNDTHFLLKDFAAAKTNFLFIASANQVGKGLDLLLEIFPKHPELGLYVCSRFENETDFIKCYYHELYKTPNIHPIGWIQTNSEKFLDIMQRCAFVVSPSCSEGQSGSVVQCMHAGLIPIVTKETGINIEDFGVMFKNDTLKEIEKTIVKVSSFSAVWHHSHSKKTRKIAREKFSEKASVSRLREIISAVTVMRD